jgi:6,7-dimethyl-8-ribityllumazine synthase
MSANSPKPVEMNLPSSARIAIAAARFNSEIVEELLSGCMQRLAELKLPEKNITVHHVPGAFELPLAAKLLAKSKKFDAVICLGCVIRGDTPHFDYVAGQCAAGIQQVAIKTSIPIIFGVLTTDTAQQARDRIGGKHGHAGRRAADAAAEMIALVKSIKR